MEELIIEEVPFGDPISIFTPFVEDRYAFFLDSAAFSRDQGRFSFIGLDPFLVIRSKGNIIRIIEEDTQMEKRGDPFDVIRETVERFKISHNPNISPFIGGAVGYLGYDLCHMIEDLPSNAVDDLNLPDSIICLYDTVIIIDMVLRKVFISSTGFPEERGSLRMRRARGRCRDILRRLSRIGQKRVVIKGNSPPFSIYSNFKKEDYLEAVLRAKRYIEDGEIYQVNLSQRLAAPLYIPPFELYKRLRMINPSPFASFLSFGEITIASSSPECFLRLRGRHVVTRPIKGTRPRGRDKIEDRRLRQGLLRSEKDRAELVMIVDLLRNDLGKVCVYGSIMVDELIRIEAHPTVFHSVATISGTLREGVDRVELIKACFPGGSITGAPKIRAMEIIDELEPTKRGIYTGSIGYLSFSGNMDLNIVIRTFVIKDGVSYFQVGGGIVADSDPVEEYIETLHKGRALIDAVSDQSPDQRSLIQRQTSFEIEGSLNLPLKDLEHTHAP